MFINENNYSTNTLSTMNDLREIIFKNLYTDPDCINRLMGIIPKYIECLSVDYDPQFYTITIKIKKTALRKTYGRSFYHIPQFYYQFIPNIFIEFLINDLNIRGKLIQAIGEKYQDPYEELNRILMFKESFINLCQVSCLSDNIIVIKL